MEATFVYERDTKNTARFKPQDEDGDIVGVLYINKRKLNRPADQVVLLVEVLDERGDYVDASPTE